MTRRAGAPLAQMLSVAMLAVLVISLASCTTTPERTIKASEDWSRGQRLGFGSLMQFNALAVEPDGERVHVVWSGREAQGDATHLYYAQLDGAGNKVIERKLAYLFFPRQPRLVLAGGGSVHVLALARRDSTSPDGVFYMQLGPDGTPRGEGLQVSSPEATTLNFEAEGAGDGSVDVFWAEEEGGSAALLHRRLSPHGEPESDEERVATGEEPSAQIGLDGTVHLAWIGPGSGSGRCIRYASFLGGNVAPTDGHCVGVMSAKGVGIERPIGLGLDARHVYIFRSVEWRSGLSAGLSDASYVHFPLGRPQDAREEALSVPEDAGAYEAASAPVRELEAYGLSQLVMVPPAGVERSTGFVQTPRPADGQRGQLAVAAGAAVAYRRTDDTQVVLAAYQDGRLVGYELSARTGSLSSWPVLAADAAGHLHMIWMDYDQRSSYSVYYASTDPEVRARQNTRTTQDLIFGTANTAWGMMSGLSLLPLIVILLLPVIIWCGLFYIFGGDDSVTRRGPAIAFAIALAIYYVAKLAVMSPVLAVPPGLSLMPVWLRSAWPFLMLLIIAAMAGLVFWRAYWRRAERPALFPAVLWFTLVDAVLTILLYAITFFGD
jgi:hypothetical protein